MRKYVTVQPSQNETRSSGFNFQSRVSPADFVRVWLSSRTLEEVAQKTGLKVSAVGQRARSYIKKGVQLPPLQKATSRFRPVPKIPVQDLNDLIYSAKKDA